MSIIDNMKKRIKESGSSRKEVFYIGADQKKRIRFIDELDEGKEFTFHSHWNKGINALCGETYGVDCPYCEDTDEEMKTYDFYAWNVFDYDSNAVKILLYKATGITPVQSFIEFFEEYGTIKDRDYTIKKVGKGMSGSMTVIPGERTSFRNKKAKPYNDKQIIKILREAFPIKNEDVYDEDYEKETKVSRRNKSTKSRKKELTLEEKISNLEEDEIIEIAYELGIEKKEIKGMDSDEIVELMFDDYEEEDIQDVYDELYEE